jgi:Glycine zipper
MHKFAAVILALCIAAMSLSGCMQTRAQRGAVYGGVAGAAIGGVASRSVGGAVVGGALGAGVGYILGSHAHRCWKTNIFTGQQYRGTCYY